VTQTSPERTTSRQRRIEAQRNRIDAMQRAQRRRRLSIIGVVVVVAIVVVAGIILLFPRPAGDTMRQVPTENGVHVDPGTPLTYRSRPPSSGMHYGAVPQVSDYRMYDQPVTPGLWVHMLEHGAVVVLYRQDLCDGSCTAQLGEVFDAAPRSTRFGVRKLAITPYQNMDHAVAVVAWGYVDELDSVDKSRILGDIKSKMDAPTAPEQAL
jgi:Protein of unknown function (DUF3105)